MNYIFKLLDYPINNNVAGHLVGFVSIIEGIAIIAGKLLHLK